MVTLRKLSAMACPKIYHITIPAWLSFVRRLDPIQQTGHTKQHGEDAQGFYQGALHDWFLVRSRLARVILLEGKGENS